MSPINARNRDTASNRLSIGLRVHAGTESKTRALQLAERLAELYDEKLWSLGIEEGTTLERIRGSIDTRTLHRIRKVSEVLEDDLGIDLGHRKFVRIASSAATLSSFVSLAIATRNLLIDSVELEQAAANVPAPDQVDADVYSDFYRSLAVFIAECFLFYTPFNFKLAWRSTRYLNNHFLYRLRDLAPKLHRLILSEIHYAIRGILPSALHNPEEFTSYIVSMVTQSVEIVRQHSSESLGELVDRIGEFVDEYVSFVQSYYEILVPEIEYARVIREVQAELLGF